MELACGVFPAYLHTCLASEFEDKYYIVGMILNVSAKTQRVRSSSKYSLICHSDSTDTECMGFQVQIKWQ